MKPSLEKLKKFFRLEAERGYDNRAVLGGFERMLDIWESEARSENVPEDLIQMVGTRLRDYSRLSEKSRAEALQGLWKRIQRSEPEESDEPSMDVEKIAIHGPAALSSEPVSDVEEADETSKTIDFESQPITVETDFASPSFDKSKRKPINQESEAIIPTVEPIALRAPITILYGVGPRIAQNLSRLGLVTLKDMLYHFPRRYNDYSRLKPINRLVYGEVVTVIGTIKNVATRSVRSGKATLIEALVSDGSGTLRVNWFNSKYFSKRLHEGLQVSLSGKVDQYLGRLVMTNPEMEPVEEQQLHTNRIVPIYPLTSKVTQNWLRKQINQVVTYWAPRIQDPLPEHIRESARLMDLSTALLEVHFPESWERLKSAQERLSFDEIFLLQLGVLRQKRAWQDRQAAIFIPDPDWLQAQIGRLPFSLTGAQQRALQDIVHDLSIPRPMNRLIQGDVGSGKTVIAGLAAAIIANHGAQVSLMAPTGILAEQHYKNLLRMLADKSEPTETKSLSASPPLLSHEIRLLLGSTSEGEKSEIRAGLADGSIKMVIGTHALIEDPIEFQNLQLAIIDEQHRFGVEQRAKLRAKGDNPHLIVMTATPIPRSLALTVYGDLDLTLIDEMPPGRQMVSTHLLMPRERERAYSLIRNQVEKGLQAFIIYPLIEESEKSEALAAVDEQQRLQKEIFPHLRVGLLHGRMKPDEKDEVMERFREGEYPILVSTTVIEVGVDIPNASVMLIESANRFGLAQLHQLRGRVGRGAEKSYCLLIPDQSEKLENERLQVMVSTNDGFVLAERDLEQRGPGQFLGARQSGFEELNMANLSDIHLIEKARRHAIALFDSDPDLCNSENKLLASSLQQFWNRSQGDIS